MSMSGLRYRVHEALMLKCPICWDSPAEDCAGRWQGELVHRINELLYPLRRLIWRPIH